MDHPRSRGVYATAQFKKLSNEGSSPLARGLLLIGQDHGRACWIIPARAGFTGSPPRRPSTRTDHPRSRGVYSSQFHTVNRQEGSSPLARGLLVGAGRQRRPGGIIPARAGFTSRSPSRGRCTGDHPRSRGVYTCISIVTHLFEGSSPLARGLLERLKGFMTPTGIIPARAGFTLADPWNPNDGLPYQTAFTFTGDLAPAPPSCGSAVVSRRSTTTPSAA